MFATCRLGLHISGELAADAVVVGTDVVKTPTSELLGTMELPTHKFNAAILGFADVKSNDR